MKLAELSVSLVVYHSDKQMLVRAVERLNSAVAYWRQAQGRASAPCSEAEKVRLIVIDNAATDAAESVSWQAIVALTLPWLTPSLHAGHGNVGYGIGHNLALDAMAPHFHLILNPDVDIAEDALAEAEAFFASHADVIALSPRIVGGDGRLQYLCRRYPTLADLFVRGFLPRRWRHHFDARLARYELRADIDRMERRDAALSVDAFYPPIISGCFMLFRSTALRALNGFDPRYFLYFEDYDLSLRAGQMGRLAYVPAVRITHYGGGAARKGRRHIQLFLASAAKFFQRFGWRLG